MKKSAMQDIHDMNQKALTSYANHQLQSLQNKFGTGQDSTNKKPQQTTPNTSTNSNKKISSLWDELNEEKSKSESGSLWEELNEGKNKPESGNFESSNVTYIKNPPIINQQPVQSQNLQFEQTLKQIQDLEQALVQAKYTIEEKDNIINGIKDNLGVKDNKIMELQGKLLEKTEQIVAETNKYNDEHNKYVNIKVKLNTHKLKLTTFIDNYQDVDGQDQLVKMLSDLQIENNE